MMYYEPHITNETAKLKLLEFIRTELVLFVHKDRIQSACFILGGGPVGGLNPTYELRPYQVEAFARFVHCLNNDFPGKQKPLHLLFNMATGSGKTLIMAGLIRYLYERD